MVTRYHEYHPGLASGAQPTAEDLNELQTEGWEVIVNLSPASTRNALPEEARVVESLGMDYVHFPVDCSSLKPFHYQTFQGILTGSRNRRVFVHCGANIKSSNLIHLYRVLEDGLNPEQSLAELLTLQNPEPKWLDYFEKMGISQGVLAR